MARNNRGKNNNPEGRNQYSGWMDSAKDRPYTTAAVTAAAVGAGVFLWSRRNQISDQISNLSDQISDWSSNMRSSDGEMEMEMADSGGSGASMNRGTQGRSGSSRSRGMSETGGGNASLGAHSGGGGSTGSASGRGKAAQSPTS